MFDPTAFDNLKTVLEGALYDSEFEGSLVLKDRKDLVDLSSLSRTYKMEVALPHEIEDEGFAITSTITLHADLENLSMELLKKETVVGCSLHLVFTIPKSLEDMTEVESITSILKNIWGENRTIEMTEKKLFQEGNFVQASLNISVLFDRLITEEQISDIPELVQHLVHSLRELEAVWNG